MLSASCFVRPPQGDGVRSNSVAENREGLRALLADPINMDLEPWKQIQLSQQAAQLRYEADSALARRLGVTFQEVMAATRSLFNGRTLTEKQLGTRKAQTIGKDDIEDLVDYMLTRGRKRGGKPGTGLSGRSVNLTLGRLKATFELAVLEGKLVRNLVALVDKVSYQQAERHTWTQAEVRKFLGAIADDRLAVAWRLPLYGLRRGEVLGLRWSVVIAPPKSQNGFRTPPLDDELLTGLKALRITRNVEQPMSQRAPAAGKGRAGQAGRPYPISRPRSRPERLAPVADVGAVATTGLRRVRAGTAVDAVVAASGGDDVVAAAGGHRVVAVARIDRVVAVSGGDLVVA
jgi:integrase